MDSGLIYANARIKSLENNLLTTEKMLRMVESKSLGEAIKVLIESNYGGGIVLDNPNKFYELLVSEELITNNFIKGIMVENKGLELFFYRLDYHNAKAIMKAKYLKLDNADLMLTQDGMLSSEKMYADIMGDDYSNMPEYMKSALEEIDGSFVTGNRSPQVIDITIDKAFYKHASIIAKKAEPCIKKYFVALVDTTNISTFTRCRRAKKTIKAFANSFVEGGELKLEFFIDLYEDSVEVVSEKFRYTIYKDLVGILVSGSDALVDFETAVDNYLLGIFKADKFNMFSIAPMAGYYLAKQTEIKVAKIILVCLKNGVDKLLIKQRLRELYA